MLTAGVILIWKCQL